MKALNDYIFLKYVKEKKTGILTSDIVSGQKSVAEVCFIGDEVKKVKPGQMVAVSPFQPEKIIINGEEYFYLREKYVLAIINEGRRKN